MSWKLDDFKVERKHDWKSGTDSYEGEVQFVNDDRERFKLKLSEQTTAEILNLILPDLAFATGRLTEKLWDHVEEQKNKILKQ